MLMNIYTCNDIPFKSAGSSVAVQHGDVWFWTHSTAGGHGTEEKLSEVTEYR